MAAHTPGPWIVGITVDQGWPVFRLRDLGDPDANGTEVLANRRLIATAPELLEACKATGACEEDDCRPDHHGLCQTHNVQPVEECWVKLVRAAIAAAEGE